MHILCFSFWRNSLAYYADELVGPTELQHASGELPDFG